MRQEIRDKKQVFLWRLMTAFVGAVLLCSFISVVYAAHVDDNISSQPTEHWAWNDVLGWIDFRFSSPGEVGVQDNKLTGYALSAVGFIAFDCATMPDSPTCSGSAGNWFVSNDGDGNLAGWAWSDAIGWISFCGNGSSGSTWNGSTWVCPLSPGQTYQVTIIDQGDDSDFFGWAWNDIVGWISFNCVDTGTCGSVDYLVKTTWLAIPPPFPTDANLVSNIFDTCAVAPNCGAQLNTVMFKGELNGGVVRFQIASSDSEAGPWNFIGSDGTGVSYYTPTDSELPAVIPPLHHANRRYLRYKIFLEPCNDPPCSPPETPVVEEVMLNWSP